MFLRTLIIDSKNATTTGANYKFTLPDRILNVSKMRFNRMIFPNNFYTIKAADSINGFANNTFIVTPFGGVATTITIPSGIYTLTSLCLAIQTQLIIVDANFTCTANATTYLITIANGVTNFTVTIGTNVSILLGMDSTTVMAASAVGTRIPNLVQTKYITIHCNELSKYIYQPLHSDARSGVMNIVPMSGTFGDLITYESTMSKWFEFNSKRDIISFVIFNFKDEHGYYVDFKGGSWELEIEFS